MAKNGKNVVLARDLTDAMYNPAKSPFVSHRRGTEFVIEHIEKHVCPSILSGGVLGESVKPHVVFLIGEDEYHTAETLPAFAKEELEKRGLRCTFIYSDAKNKNEIPGLDALNSADLLFVSVRRRIPPPEQLAMIKAYVESGRPVVGIRTASHAFALLNKPDGWPGFDKEVLGGDYKMHYDNTPEKGPPTVCHVIEAAAKHPILAGVPAEFTSKGTLYRNKNIAKDATPLLWGTFGDSGERENVAWTHAYKGGRVFYTSLGHPDDFQNAAFRKLLLNGVFWALERAVPAKP